LTNGILWIVDTSVQLHAYDASNLADELYHASIGSYVKFSTPTIANGKVYVGTTNSLVVFGLRIDRRQRLAPGWNQIER
jgi:hypothetical protein